jgi:hypothetical protein
MRSIGAAPAGGDDRGPWSEVDQIEQWVAEQLALAPELSPAQLGRLQVLLATAPVVAAKSA